MRSPDGPGTRRKIPPVLVPWLVYVGVTTVAPAVNGAGREAGFAEHAVITLGVSGAVLMLWLAAGRVRPRRFTPRARRAGSGAP